MSQSLLATSAWWTRLRPRHSLHTRAGRLVAEEVEVVAAMTEDQVRTGVAIALADPATVAETTEMTAATGTTEPPQAWQR